jgi:hypothetical protein
MLGLQTPSTSAYFPEIFGMENRAGRREYCPRGLGEHIYCKAPYHRGLVQFLKNRADQEFAVGLRHDHFESLSDSQ